MQLDGDAKTLAASNFHRLLVLRTVKTMHFLLLHKRGRRLGRLCTDLYRESTVALSLYLHKVLHL